MKLISSPFKSKGESYLGEIYRPYIQVLITTDKVKELFPIEMLIDTGADYTLLPKLLKTFRGKSGKRLQNRTNSWGWGSRKNLSLQKPCPT